MARRLKMTKGAIRKRKWAHKNQGRVRANVWRQNLKRYGMTPAQYDVMLEAQGGVCAICGKRSPNDRRLHVDHDHKTGKVRAILCARCNVTLGRVNDDKGLLQRLIAYLEWHKT